MLLHMGFHCFCHYLLKRLSFFHLCNFVKNQLSIPWQFWILLQRTWECRYLLEIMILFLSGIHSVVGFLNPVVGFSPPPHFFPPSNLHSAFCSGCTSLYLYQECSLSWTFLPAFVVSCLFDNNPRRG